MVNFIFIYFIYKVIVQKDIKNINKIKLMFNILSLNTHFIH